MEALRKPKILSKVLIKPYFQKGDFVLYNSDSIEFLNNLPENSIDMVFADPPYNLSNGGFTVHAGRMVSVNKGEWDVSRGFKGGFSYHKALEMIRFVSTIVNLMAIV